MLEQEHSMLNDADPHANATAASLYSSPQRKTYLTVLDYFTDRLGIPYKLLQIVVARCNSKQTGVLDCDGKPHWMCAGVAAYPNISHFSAFSATNAKAIIDQFEWLSSGMSM